MVARIYKKPAHIDSGGTAVDPTRVFHFGGDGTISESEIRDLVSASYGPTIAVPGVGTMFRTTPRCTQTAYDQWDADIEYLRRPTEIGTFTWSLDGTGTTEKVTHSLETIAKYPAATAPDFKRAIGVEHDNVIGAEVIRPFGKLTITYSHPAGIMTMPYAKFLLDLDGSVNSGPFFTWSAGEVRYMGTVSSDGTDTQATAVYNFEVQKNRTGIVVGDITGIAKKGWELSWVKFKPSETTVGGVTYPTRIPEFVYIERMSDLIDFRTAFGFGA